MRTSKWSRTSGFTLVEVITAIGIIGALIGLSLPAVQRARESARAASCQNNLRNVAVALHSFVAARGAFPVGCDALGGTQNAWSAKLLPYLEEHAIAGQFDYRQAWNSAANQTAAGLDVQIYVCPSSLLRSPGKQDYGGVMGTALLALKPGMGPKDAFGCGVLITTSSQQATAVTPARISDGLSQTLCVGESSDRAGASSSLWACGLNCFSQNDPYVDMDDVGSLHSEHPTGAHGLFADGHVRLLDDAVNPAILGSICTRNGNEIPGSGEVPVSSVFLQ